METIEISLNEYQPHPRNPNTHPDNQLDALGDSLNKFSQVKNIVVWRGYYLAGHGLAEAARRRGLKALAAVDVSGWDEEQAIAFMLADNRLSEMAIMDPVALGDLLVEMDNPMEIPGFDEDFLASLDFGNGDEPPEDAGPQVDRAEELQKEWGTEVGQLWAMKEHRLAVGDCTDRGVVEQVMGGERTNLFLTDPPYGVSYADKNAFLNTLAKGNAVQKRIENDHQSMDDMKSLWYQAAKNAYDFSEDTASYYWFACQGGDQMMMMMMMAIGDAGWKVRHELIWVKNNHVMGRSDYQYKHEPILYGWKRKGTHKWFGGFQTSVLEFNKPQKSDLHPTTKPVDLIEFLTINSTRENSIVYDPFLGSGTTLIACENLTRRCRGIEIDPGYAAICLQRYHDTFGVQPELIGVTEVTV
jgi:DNA modification methylase